ncbi:MAG: ribosomal protein S18-alanine N-acetyltransferase [Anaerolineae bacterium]|nr:ribosomal protein S18-alanine N-acetyltransferase [Anaerolineae bacterium]
MTASGGPSSAPIQLRPFTPADLQAVLRLEKRVFPLDAYGRYEFLNLYRWGRETFLVAVQGERLVGYVAALLNDSEKEGYIASVAVDPEQRRAGLGTRLMNTVVDKLRAEGVASVALHVRAENEPAIGMYRRLGFDVEQVEPHYYPDGMDALVMRRVLGER